MFRIRFLIFHTKRMTRSYFQVNEILISRQQAEKVLREHKDVVSALEALIN